MNIEKELFDWLGWDGDHECMIFYNPVLKVQVGKYSPGTMFDFATILQNDNGCMLQLSNATNDVTQNPKVMGEYKLHYRIGDTISEAG